MGNAIPSNAATASLRILGTSDVHMHLGAPPLQTGETAPEKSFARVAQTLAKARETAPGACVLFDNGDALQGTPAANIAMEQGNRADHPWPRILGALNYTAIGLGNHDFDYGLDALAEICDQIPCPVLSASPDKALAHVLGHTIIDVPMGEHGLRLGVTSVLPPQTRLWNHSHLAGRLDFLSGVEACQAAVAALRAEQADLIVVLCHSGIAESGDGETENFAHVLARDVPGIDAMILGHSHERFPETAGQTLAGVPAVMPAFNGKGAGQIDLALEYVAERWQVTGHSVTLLGAQEHKAHDGIAELCAPLLTKTDRHCQTVVGHVTQRMHSYFAMLQSGAVDGLVGGAMIDALAQETAGTELGALPLVAAVSPFAAGGRAGPGNYVDIASGPITRGHLNAISPYQNAIWGHVMTGATLRRYAEHGARFFGPTRGEQGPLVAPRAPAFNFDMLHGMLTTIDPFAPVGERITSLTHGGIEVGADDTFLVALSSYRGAGGGGFPGTGVNAAIITQTALTNALETCLRAQNALVSNSVWHFAKHLGKTVTIETSPRAAEHLDDIARFNPEPLGLTEAGFIEIAVTL